MPAFTANTLSAFSLTKAVEPARESPVVVDPAVASLTAGLVSGEEVAFREFHARYFDRLYCFLLVITRGNEEEAGEALQQTLLRVARYARRFNSEEVFWSWLKAVARSVSRDAGRQRQRYASLLQRFALFARSPAPESHSPEEHTLRDLLAEIMEQLPADERQLLEGKYVSGESVKELAARTGLTEKAIEGRLGRLRQSVRTRLLKRLRTT